MPDFLARVVLHRIDDSDDYTELHTEMEKVGFRKHVINGDPRFNNNTLKMPTGTYYFDSKIPANANKFTSVDEAYDAVKAAVDEVTADETVYIQNANNPPTLFVVQVVAARWFLEIV